ncbi:MAG TPA: ComF family protein [Sphingobacterium sp.]|nr:ComF family protein [Sphingobacterium sp.]
MKSYLRDLLHVFLPQVCFSCDESLLYHEEVLCMTCLYHLPLTDFHLDNENETARQLWGKINFQRAISMLYLAKSSRVEKLLYRLKYNNQPEIGIFLGKYYARKLLEINFFEAIDIIVPVPIHRSKLRKRGYNQSSQFAKGLSTIAQVPWTDKLLARTVSSVSQTKKSRIERYENVAGVFELNDQTAVQGKNILLVDDVLTTGATICTVGNILVEAGAKVSILTIARA